MGIINLLLICSIFFFLVGKFIVRARVNENRQTFSLHKPEPSDPLFVPICSQVLPDCADGARAVCFTISNIQWTIDHRFVNPEPSFCNPQSWREFYTRANDTCVNVCHRAPEFAQCNEQALSKFSPRCFVHGTYIYIRSCLVRHRPSL